jgi:hypothetical protein
MSIVQSRDTTNYYHRRGGPSGLFRAADALVRSINERRLDAVAPLLHPRACLEFPSGRRRLEGRAHVIAHLRRLYRDLEGNGPDYVIIEANERPGLANHEPQPTAERFVDLLFPQTASSRR